MSSPPPPLPFKVTPQVFHVLLSLVDGEMHAYGIMKAVESRTEGSLRIAPGSLHFTLTKLLDASLLEEVEGEADDTGDSRRRLYRLTERGRRVVSAEATQLARTVEFARERNLIGER